MPRPCKCRRIFYMPGVTYFKPAGVPVRMLTENRLSVEELEAIRLKDMESLEQVECARRMGVSRATYQRVLSSGRKKVADSLLSGKALRIEGGSYRLASPTDNLESVPVTTGSQENKSEGGKMKIAVVTEDGTSISQHFGRAPFYMVFSVEGGKITGKEQRPKMGHNQFAGHEGPHAANGTPHGFDAESQNRHAGIALAIEDCQTLIAGGMGMGAFESLKSYNIEPVVTDVRDMEQAVRLHIDGKLPNLMERLH